MNVQNFKFSWWWRFKSCLMHCDTVLWCVVNTEAVWSSETLVGCDITAPCHKPEDHK